MVAVEFEDTEGRAWDYVFGAVQQADGRGRPPAEQAAEVVILSRSRSPWAHFGGRGWPRFLCLGGRVYGEGVTLVRVIDARGRVLEDNVDGAIALPPSNDRLRCHAGLNSATPLAVCMLSRSWPPEHRARRQ